MGLFEAVASVAGRTQAFSVERGQRAHHIGRIVRARGLIRRMHRKLRKADIPQQLRFPRL